MQYDALGDCVYPNVRTPVIQMLCGSVDYICVWQWIGVVIWARFQGAMSRF